MQHSCTRCADYYLLFYIIYFASHTSCYLIIFYAVARSIFLIILATFSVAGEISKCQKVIMYSPTRMVTVSQGTKIYYFNFICTTSPPNILVNCLTCVNKRLFTFISSNSQINLAFGKIKIKDNPFIFILFTYYLHFI